MSREAIKFLLSHPQKQRQERKTQIYKNKKKNKRHLSGSLSTHTILLCFIPDSQAYEK